MKIGNLDLSGNVFLAPMAGITDPPFRKMVQRFGVSALWTEMISAHGIARAGVEFRTMELSDHRVPTVFQIYGHDPTFMAEAARRIQDLGAAAVDVNMGCPARRVVGSGSGAALMRNVPLAARIVSEVRRVLSIPLTVKIRSGWDESNTNAAAVAQATQQEGADAVIVHSRSRAKQHSGSASLSVIREVKQAVSIPVIGNGGVQSESDAIAMVSASGCDGVMVGRGALGRPWIPGRILRRLAGWTNGTVEELTVFDVIRDHFRHQLAWLDPVRAVLRMRKHLAWYSRGFRGGAEFRQAVLTMEDPVLIMDFVQQFFGKVVIS